MGRVAVHGYNIKGVSMSDEELRDLDAELRQYLETLSLSRPSRRNSVSEDESNSSPPQGSSRDVGSRKGFLLENPFRSTHFERRLTLSALKRPWKKIKERRIREGRRMKQQRLDS